MARDLKLLKPIDRRFLREYIKNGGNKTKAAATVKNFDLKDPKQYNLASVWGHEAYKRCKLSAEEEMEAAGIGMGDLMEVLRQGLKAIKIVRDRDGHMVEKLNTEGKKMPEMDPDFRVRHLYMESGLKLLDAFPSSKHEITGADGGPLEVKTAGLIFNHEITTEEWGDLFGGKDSDSDTDTESSDTG